MDEFEIIDRFFSAPQRKRSDVRLGIGDDAAITRIPAGFDLVIATDSLVEGTHFLPGTPAHALGHRCLAVNLSDLAAMGAKPLWCTLALSLPDADVDWVQRFSAGFFALADRFGIALIGGDTVRGPLSVTVTVHGQVQAGSGVCRSGANVGDLVYVTGSPGSAAAGLDLLRASGDQIDVESDLVRSFWYPEPRVIEGMALNNLAQSTATSVTASAMIDISDGLHIDVSRLLGASDLGAELALDALPGFQADSALTVEQILFGGDDYELCFCVPPAAEAAFKKIVADWHCPVTKLGVARKDVVVSWLINGTPYDGNDSTFVHFE